MRGHASDLAMMRMLGRQREDEDRLQPPAYAPTESAGLAPPAMPSPKARMSDPGEVFKRGPMGADQRDYIGAQLKSLEMPSPDAIAFSQPKPKALPRPPSVALTRGDSGDDVVKLQERLAASGFDPGKIDGVFGPKTLAALQAFQAEAGISADGAAGRETEMALEEWENWEEPAAELPGYDGGSSEEPLDPLSVSSYEGDDEDALLGGISEEELSSQLGGSEDPYLGGASSPDDAGFSDPDAFEEQLSSEPPLPEDEPLAMKRRKLPRG